MKKLTIHSNDLGDIGAKHLSTCLHKVQELDVDGCGITSIGFKDICTAVDERPYPLRYINLEHNHLDEEAEKLFINCLHNIVEHERSAYYMKKELTPENKKLLEEKLEALKDRINYKFTYHTSSLVGEEGARLDFGGCIVQIPQGALDQKVLIKLTSYYGKRTETNQITPMLKCEPNHLKFKKDISITLPTCFTSEIPQLIVVKQSDDGLEWNEVESNFYRNELSYTFHTAHFTWFSITKIKEYFWSKIKCLNVELKIKFEFYEPRTRLMYFVVFDNIDNKLVTSDGREQLTSKSFKSKSEHKNASLQITKVPAGVECEPTSFTLNDFYDRPKDEVEVQLTQLGSLQPKDIKFNFKIVSNDEVVYGDGSEGVFRCNPFREDKSSVSQSISADYAKVSGSIVGTHEAIIDRSTKSTSVKIKAIHFHSEKRLLSDVLVSQSEKNDTPRHERKEDSESSDEATTPQVQAASSSKQEDLPSTSSLC